MPKKTDATGLRSAAGRVQMLVSAVPLPVLIADLSQHGADAVFAFRLCYCEPPEYFEEISRYILELDEYTGRQGVFKGTVVIDCAQWTGSEQSEYFDAFLAYLSDHQKGIRYVFCTSREMPHQAMYKKLSEYFSVSLLPYARTSVMEKSSECERK